MERIISATAVGTLHKINLGDVAMSSVVNRGKGSSLAIRMCLSVTA